MSTRLILFSLSVASYSSLVSAQSDKASLQGIPTWVAYAAGGVLVLMILYYCCRKVSPESPLQTPLLGAAYNDDGTPLMRQDVDESAEEKQGQWKCEVCDFVNKTTAKTCILCGTEKGFSFGITTPRHGDSVMLSPTSASAEVIRPGSTRAITPQQIFAKRQRSFAIRRLNMLTERQKGARHRSDWVRKVGIDGKRYWARRNANEALLKKLENENLTKGSGSSKTLSKQTSLAFVSRLAHTPTHPEGRLTFTEVNQVDPSLLTHGNQISEQDLEVLEHVASFSFKEKYAWFQQQTSALIKPWEEGHLKMRVNRNNLLVGSMEQLLGVQPEHIHMPLRIEFIGEAGIDAGGVEREWFELLTESLFDESIGLFRCAHVENLSYVINPTSADASVDHLLYFRGAGRLIGRALLEGQLMKAHLALPMLKHLLGVPISFFDLEFIDGEVYRNLKWLKENTGVEALCLDFSVVQEHAGGETQVIDLKGNGRNIEVTDENKHEYIYLRLRWIILGSISEQLKNLMTGIFDVIPQELLLVFDYQELELVLCGVPEIDVDDWEKYTIASEDFPPDLLKWFWDIVRGWTYEERAKLLQYATGSSRVPVQGFKALTSYDGRVCLFTLRAIPYDAHAFPRAHTCFNRIDLPLYTSKEELETHMSLVINLEVTGFTDE